MDKKTRAYLALIMFLLSISKGLKPSFLNPYILIVFSTGVNSRRKRFSIIPFQSNPYLRVGSIWKDDRTPGSRLFFFLPK